MHLFFRHFLFTYILPLMIVSFTHSAGAQSDSVSNDLCSPGQNYRIIEASVGKVLLDHGWPLQLESNLENRLVHITHTELFEIELHTADRATLKRGTIGALGFMNLDQTTSVELTSTNCEI